MAKKIFFGQWTILILLFSIALVLAQDNGTIAPNNNLINETIPSERIKERESWLHFCVLC